MMEFPIILTGRDGIACSDVFTDMAPGNVVTLQARGWAIKQHIPLYRKRTGFRP